MGPGQAGPAGVPSERMVSEEGIPKAGVMRHMTRREAARRCLNNRAVATVKVSEIL